MAEVTALGATGMPFELDVDHSTLRELSCTNQDGALVARAWATFVKEPA